MFGVDETEALKPEEVADIQCGTQFSVVLNTNGQVQFDNVVDFIEAYSTNISIAEHVWHIKWFSISISHQCRDSKSVKMRAVGMRPQAHCMSDGRRLCFQLGNGVFGSTRSWR